MSRKYVRINDEAAAKEHEKTDTLFDTLAATAGDRPEDDERELNLPSLLLQFTLLTSPPVVMLIDDVMDEIVTASQPGQNQLGPVSPSIDLLLDPDLRKVTMDLFMNHITEAFVPWMLACEVAANSGQPIPSPEQFGAVVVNADTPRTDGGGIYVAFTKPNEQWGGNKQWRTLGRVPGSNMVDLVRLAAVNGIYVGSAENTRYRMLKHKNEDKNFVIKQISRTFQLGYPTKASASAPGVANRVRSEGEVRRSLVVEWETGTLNAAVRHTFETIVMLIARSLSPLFAGQLSRPDDPPRTPFHSFPLNMSLPIYETGYQRDYSAELAAKVEAMRSDGLARVIRIHNYAVRWTRPPGYIILPGLDHPCLAQIQISPHKQPELRLGLSVPLMSHLDLGNSSDSVPAAVFLRAGRELEFSSNGTAAQSWDWGLTPLAVATRDCWFAFIDLLAAEEAVPLMTLTTLAAAKANFKAAAVLMKSQGLAGEAQRLKDDVMDGIKLRMSYQFNPAKGKNSASAPGYLWTLKNRSVGMTATNFTVDVVELGKEKMEVFLRPIDHNDKPLKNDAERYEYYELVAPALGETFRLSQIQTLTRPKMAMRTLQNIVNYYEPFVKENWVEGCRA